MYLHNAPQRGKQGDGGNQLSNSAEESDHDNTLAAHTITPNCCSRKLTDLRVRVWACRVRGAVGHIGSVDRFQLSIPIIHWGYDLSVNGLTAGRRRVCAYVCMHE